MADDKVFIEQPKIDYTDKEAVEAAGKARIMEAFEWLEKLKEPKIDLLDATGFTGIANVQMIAALVIATRAQQATLDAVLEELKSINAKLGTH